MRRLLIGIAGLALFAMRADAMGPIDDWSGVYKDRFENSDVDGRKYQSENVMEIARLDGAHAYVSLSLEFYNGHTCGFGAIMTEEGNRLTYSGEYYAGQTCDLSITRDSSDGKPGLVLHDQEGHCARLSCGFRGYYEDIRFVDSTRSSEPTDIDREAVRQSDEYRAALAEAGEKRAQ